MNAMSSSIGPKYAQPAADAMYLGSRTKSGTCVVIRTLQQTTELRPRLDLIRHAPVGFDWANGSSSGAAQLALALLAHATGDDSIAREHHQVFMHEIILRLPRAGWSLAASQVLQMLHFVSVDFAAAALSESRAHSPKTAVMRAVLPGDHYSQDLITASGSGRSIRRAATRALLTLLGNKRLRRQRIVQLQIELSIFGGQENDSPGLDAPETAA